MKNILIIASLASIAAAITVYFMIEKNNNNESWYVSNDDILDFDSRENTGPAIPVS